MEQNRNTKHKYKTKQNRAEQNSPTEVQSRAEQNGQRRTKVHDRAEYYNTPEQNRSTKQRYRIVQNKADNLLPPIFTLHLNIFNRLACPSWYMWVIRLICLLSLMASQLVVFLRVKLVSNVQQHQKYASQTRLRCIRINTLFSS